MTIYPIFPQPFFSTNVDWDFKKLRQDKRYIYNREQLDDGRTRPQIFNTNILDFHPELKQNITEVFNGFAIELYGPNTNEFILTTSWLTEIKKGDQIHYHNHNNAMFSGILYYDEEYAEDVEDLRFKNTYDLMSTGFKLDWGDSQYKHFHSGFTVTPQPGRLCFWRAGLIHYSMRSKSEKIRRSLAMNFVPKGEFGEADSYLNTDWFNDR